MRSALKDSRGLLGRFRGGRARSGGGIARSVATVLAGALFALSAPYAPPLAAQTLAAQTLAAQTLAAQTIAAQTPTGRSDAAADAPLTPQERALHVLDRLGYGPAPGDLERVERIGVERYIDEQLTPERIPLPDTLQSKLNALPTRSMTVGQLFAEYGPPSFPPKSAGVDALKEARQRARTISRDAHRARLWQAAESPRQLEEVMTEFWFNHFNIFEAKEWDRYWVANFEQTAIRPNALGDFRQLLGAVAHHPAMLYYLDNWLSTAADAPGARGRFKGLNENYARELLELHTLGVNGGYTQDDVISLARILTGWTIDVQRLRRGDGGGFQFAEARHDFGDKLFLGKHIGGAGVQEGERALDMLAAHPSTAKAIATQLVQYFVSDDPRPELVDRIAARFTETHGNMRLVLKTLFDSPEFWSRRNYQTKFKSPYQFVLSAIRASGTPMLNTRPAEGALAQLGMPLYGWLTPDGYKTTRDAWLNPDAMLRRIDFALGIGTGRTAIARPEPTEDPMNAGAGSGAAARGDGARRAAGGAGDNRLYVDPAQLEATLGPALSTETLATVDHSPNALRAAMILGGPEFMRR